MLSPKSCKPIESLHSFLSLLLFTSSSKPLSSLSSSSPPSHDDITHLILTQKSPSSALQTFRWASQIPNFIHTQSTYKAIIHKLCLSDQFPKAIQLLFEIPKTLNSPPQDDIFIRIIKDLGQFKRSQDAIKVLNLITQFESTPSLKIYNSILDVLVKDDIDLARVFFRKYMMKDGGIVPDDYTFGILMKGLCATNKIAESFKLLEFMKNQGFKPNTVIYNTLIHGLCKNGKIGRARSLMREIENPSDVTFNILISGYCKEGDFLQGLVVFEKSLGLGLVPDVVTVTKLVECLCLNDRVKEATEVLQRVEEKGGVIDVVAYNTLIQGFVRNGEIRVGRKLLKDMALKGCLPNLKIYNSLMCGYCEDGDMDMAMDLFYEMMGDDGISPDCLTCEVLVCGLFRVGKIEDGFRVLRLMEEKVKFNGDEVVGLYNSLMYVLYRDDKMEKVYELLHRMKDVSLVSRVYDESMRVMELCEVGDVDGAKKVYDHMVDRGDVPSVVVYSWLVDGFCRDGRMEEAFGLLNEMMVKDWFPNLMTLNCLVLGFCMRGEVENAVKVMEEMKRMVKVGLVPKVLTWSIPD